MIKLSYVALPLGQHELDTRKVGDRLAEPLALLDIEPGSSGHRRYEALRAYFVHEMPAAEMADRFGADPGLLVFDHQQPLTSAERPNTSLPLSTPLTAPTRVSSIQFDFHTGNRGLATSAHAPMCRIACTEPDVTPAATMPT